MADRLGLLRIAPDMLSLLLKRGLYTVTDGLPEDAHIVRWQADEIYLTLVIESESFPAVAPGCEIPTLEPPHFTRDVITADPSGVMVTCIASQVEAGGDSRPYN